MVNKKSTPHAQVIDNADVALATGCSVDNIASVTKEVKVQYKKRLIDANALCENIKKQFCEQCKAQGKDYQHIVCSACNIDDALLKIEDTPTVDAVEVVHGARLYNAHEVAEILADAFGDPCACNFNGNDEWLPEKCELLDACPYPVGVACWEQYLKYRDAKMDGDGNG